MEKTTQYAYITFHGNDDFPLEIVTERLGVQPTKTWKVGERVHPNNQLERSYTCWKFESDTLETLDSEEVLRPILDVFQSKIDTINQLKEELDLQVHLELVIQVYDGYTPGLVIYPDLSAFVAAINAFIDIDMYAYPYDEQEKE